MIDVELVTYKVRMTGSGAYSIDKYKDGEFEETISPNNLFNESNEEELNKFAQEIIEKAGEEGLTDQEFIDELKLMYEKKYGIVDEDGLDDMNDGENDNDSISNVKVSKDMLFGYEIGFKSIINKEGLSIENGKLKIGVNNYTYLASKYFNKELSRYFCIECGDNGEIKNFSKEEKRIFEEGLKKEFKENEKFTEYYFHGIIEGMFFEEGKIDNQVSIINSKKIFGLSETEVFYPVFKDLININS